MDSLRNLPAGAVYEKKSGQAGLKLGYQDGNIVATATCDSLQVLVYQLEEEVSRLTRENTELNEQSKPPESRLKWYLYGTLTGIIISFTLFKLRK